MGEHGFSMYSLKLQEVCYGCLAQGSGPTSEAHNRRPVSTSFAVARVSSASAYGLVGLRIYTHDGTNTRRLQREPLIIGTSLRGGRSRGG